MSDNSKIQWTDATWNCVRGCTKISPGCKNCYAATFAERFRGVPGHPYEQGFDLRLVPDKLDAPLHWKKPRRVFVNSMSDLFHEDVPDDYIDQVLAVCFLASWHTFQILTKRAKRMARYFASKYRWALIEGAAQKIHHERTGEEPSLWLAVHSLPNVWLGVSVENQECADERIPFLLRTPAAVRFLSVEPLLERVVLPCACGEDPLGHDRPCPWAPEMRRVFGSRGIDWVIVGGESGHGARPMDLAWPRGLRDQCKAAGVAFFFKQSGPHPYERAAANLGARQGFNPDDLLADTGPRPPQMKGWTLIQTSTATWYQRHPEIKDSHGGNPAEWPEDLRVRQFPEERR